MKKTIIAIGLLLCSFTGLWSQVAMGKWRTHLAYDNVSQIAQSENKIYAVSEGALFSIDKLDHDFEFYSKLSGLNGSNILQIEYNPIDKQLLIIYDNGNIDILDDGGISNVPDLYNKVMSSDKKVNHIFFNDNIAYLSCNFGILALNMQRKEVADTYIIGPNATEVEVLNTTVYNDSIYSLSSKAIYKAASKEYNLVNFEYWTSLTNLPGSGDFQSIVSYEGKLILLRSGRLFIKEGSAAWQSFRPDLEFSGMNVSKGKLNLFAWKNFYLVDSQFLLTEVADFATVTDAEYDPINNTYWFAGNDKGVITYDVKSAGSPVVSNFKPAGPAVNIPWDMTFSGSRLFVVPGGRWGSQKMRSGAVMIYEDGVWSNILESDIPGTTNQRALDFMNVAVDPTDNKHFFVTSYGTGLYEFKNDKFEKKYTHSNSLLETIFPTSSDAYNYIRLDGAVYDSRGNLYVSNSGVASCVKVLESAGDMKQLTYPNTDKGTLGKILINNQNQNQKWVLSVRSGEVVVFDDNGTFDNLSDDKYVVLGKYSDSDNSGALIAPTTCYSIAQDNNGVIWLGTEQGPLLFNNTTNPFEAGYTCARVKIPRQDSTGLADYLLVNEKIKAIAIDGANRKWIGTESSGVYLMSENGQETLKHFTVYNSPLLSNDILSIAINPISGEVFFGTGRGVLSYQSDASVAEESFSNVHAYPNPVREGYNGVITITGLVEDTQVKITDLKGNLVCQTVSNGSLATWDGKDVHGRKVSTGIYLVICVSPDGTQSTITKILVIN